MTTLPTTLLLVAASALTFACRNAADTQTKSEGAQRQADTKIAAADAERADKNRAAQAEADMKIAEANAAFNKLRDEYRSATVLEIVALDADIAELEAKHKAATGQTKADLQTSLAAIWSSRSRYTAARAELEGIGAGGWDAAKKDLDAQWTALKALVDKG
jgi:hypothetical protein